MIRLALRVRRPDAEVVLAELLELAPNGVEETDQGELVEYAVYGEPGEVPELPALEVAAGRALVEVEAREIPDDWTDGWKRFYQPVVVGSRGAGRGIYVRPPWAAPAHGGDLIDVVIDPGRAFGTGSHRTTKMCLGLLLELEPEGPLADLGCGSAVLAIAAAKLGFEPVVAVDHEVDAVESATRNARANGVSIDVGRIDLRREPAPPARTWVANLLRPLLLELAERMTETPGHLVASGLLAEEADEVAAAFARRGLAERARRHSGEWAALLLAGAPSTGPATPSR